MPEQKVPDLTSWTGWDVRGGARADPRAVQQFEDSAPTFPSAENRYQLLAVAGRGFRPPGFLVSRTVDDSERTAPREQTDFSGLRESWSTRYRLITETHAAVEPPFAIYLLGVNPPPDISPSDLEIFNAFYTDVHLVEVAERRRALRALRYELVDEVRAPYGGAPRFLAVYEVDETSASRRRHEGPPYSSGPDVWQRHTTPWRLWFRRLGA